MSAKGLPVEIDDAEQIVRFILTPIHVDSGKSKLKRTIFRPRKGTDLVSVARTAALTGNECKAKALEAQKDPQKYVGFARISAGDIREPGSQIEDAREGYYVGHAHISHGFILPEGDPPDAVLLKQLSDRCDALLKKTTFISDPNPQEPGWSGAPLLALG